jgi:hypothetical protein
MKSLRDIRYLEVVVPGVTILAIWSVFLGYNAYQAWRDYEIVSIHGIDIITHQVKVGGNLIYTSEYTKYLPLAPTITRELVAENGVDRYVVSPVWLGDARTGHIVNKRSFLLPDDVPPGKYRLSMTWTYHPNPQHKPVSYHAVSELFEVVK